MWQLSVISSSFFVWSVSLGPIIGVHAQTSNATCTSEFVWMQNGIGQSPCIVASFLSQQCTTGNWTVPALTGRGPYNPPTGQGVTRCRCNTVVYNLLSACSSCQGGLIGTWTDWIGSCIATMITVGSYPMAPPAGTRIQDWALLDPTKNGGLFDLQLARTAHDQSQQSSNSANSSNAGAIIGGVIGGLAVVIALALLSWYLVRRRHWNNMVRVQGGGLAAPLAPVRVEPLKTGQHTYRQLNMGIDDPHAGTPAPLAGGYPTAYGRSGTDSTSPPQQYRQSLQQLELQAPNYTGVPERYRTPYDPQDPTTFPSVYPSPYSQIHPNLSGSTQNVSQTQLYNSRNSFGNSGYRGVAEI